MTREAHRTASVVAGDRLRPVSTGWLVARFTGAGVLVLMVLAALIAISARRAGAEQATESAAQVTFVIAKGIVEPRLTVPMLAGDPAAVADFDTAVRRYVLRGSLVRVKLWDSTGAVVYSDEPRLVGQRFPLPAEEAEALREQLTDSEISDLHRPENTYETQYGKLLETYVGVRGSDGRPLLFEAYFRYDAVSAAGAAAWRKFAPPSLGALLLLELLQIPLAWSLARRLRRQQQDRERLLLRAVDSSETERRRIAGELHDGVVQELTGLTYSLDAAVLRPDAAQHGDLLAETARRLRHTVGALRTLMVDIYPPDLAEEGLHAALDELAGGLGRAGVEVSVDVDGAENMSAASAALVFRVAQEAVRNVATHSRAEHVELTMGLREGQVTLVIEDDGRGFERTDLSDGLAGGHFGLRSLRDLVRDAQGTLTVRSAPGQGTRVEMTLAAR